MCSVTQLIAGSTHHINWQVSSINMTSKVVHAFIAQFILPPTQNEAEMLAIMGSYLIS